MSKKIKISVIIPTYNQKEEYLTCAIESVENQIFGAHEIIVVNDGGQNIPSSLFYDKDITVIRKLKNEGTASALNEGIKRSTGTHIAWLSSDDFFYPHFLAAHVALLSHEECSAKISYSGFSEIAVDQDDHIYSVADYKPPIESKIQNPFILDKEEWNRILIRNLHQESCQFNGCCFVIDKEVLENVGTFDESNKFTQDFDMWIRISKQYDLAVIPQILLCRREHRGRTQFTWQVEDFLSQRENEMRNMKKKYLFH